MQASHSYAILEFAFYLCPRNEIQLPFHPLELYPHLKRYINLVREFNWHYKCYKCDLTQ